MGRAPSIPAAERRAHAVRALLELACSVAPDDISTAAIAQRMGVSHAALFRHFPSRDALWAEAVQWATTELDQRFDAVGTATDDPLEAVTLLLQSHVGFLQNHPGLLRMFFAELQRPQTSPAREEGKAFMNRFRQRLAWLIEAAQREAALVSAIEPLERAGLLVAINQGLMLQGLVQNSLEGLVERAGRAHGLLLADLRPGRTAAACPAAAPGAAPAETALPRS
ncbi:TetR/AcrR family transcriptional regulator [Synechococcus sp. 1G10]|uniref:TetR/AcrR family transcriptional regulator n=1 Tax=Synechococcus sp. 1G10 TaxID=2025605 RepID=UPI001303C110|nr:TetR/AcrR family transcriptional regulator [Synechococcus sp. 1G10]